MGILKSVLRDLLDLIDLEKNVDQNTQKLEDLQKKVSSLEEGQVSQEELEENITQVKSEVREVRNQVLDVVATLDMTDRQKDIIKILSDMAGSWVTKQEIADSLDISKNNVRTNINRMPDTVTIEETTQGSRGEKVYKITQEEKEKIYR